MAINAMQWFGMLWCMACYGPDGLYDLKGPQWILHPMRKALHDLRANT